MYWTVIEFAVMLAALGAIDSLLTSVIADNITKTKHNSNRELIGQGIGNMAAALIGGIPGAGATKGTVVNINAGAAQFSGLVAGDGVFLSASGITGNTADKNVGTGLTVTVTGLTLLGPDAGNYLPETGTLTVDVAKRNLSVFAFGSANQHFKDYDGNNP